MKKLWWTLLVLALAPLAAAVEGCAEKYTCNVDSSLALFDVEGLSLTAQQRGQPVAAGESVVAADLRLVLEPQVRYYSQNKGPGTWLPAAVACPPAPMPGYKGTREILDSLVVRCVYAYDASHPAGAVANDLLLQEANSQLLPAVPPRDTQPDLYPLGLRLRQAPAQPGQQQFVVRFRLTNGEFYTARTPVFTLR
ncbi:hypothetical protein [Hymenobacter properus]|uniref:DUF5034 domain-containing protein n=1 Tax=Hymenobacter properus TaxID=2791026 RepID=A0A931FJT6_9BACT|nr:hypothetical protein [Hymenobacter properus]MBF9142258.1 hypothetical protein [Hymenobacter properus]MBR7721065.1 hypothetical protein [Microvirga sp. SRT04]